MRLRIIKNRPIFAPGGSVRNERRDINVSSTPPIHDYGTPVNKWGESDIQNIYMPFDVTLETEEGEINPFSSMPTSDPFFENYDAGYAGYLADNRGMVKNVEKSVVDNAMNLGGVDADSSKEKRSQDGNPLDPMTTPYYSPDLTGRAQMFGTSLGRIRAGNKVVANMAQAALSGVSLGLGLTRDIMGASSAAYAASRDEQAARKKLEKERRQQFIRWEREGGGVNLGNGQRIDSSDLTGEYIYPLPKSMEDNANVEIEKGEYVSTPNDVGPMEAKGNRHEDGGIPVDLPEAHIISDYRTIDDDFASYVRENYGIRATEKDTYATLLDRYKKKIGLSEKYDDQERVFKRLEKNKDVKDKNTSELNKSILSKYVNDNQKEIDELEVQFRSFADIVYNKQEESKRQEKIDAFFRDGGKVDLNAVRKQAKALNISESDAKNWIYDEYVKRVRKMAEGGPTKEQIEWGKKENPVINTTVEEDDTKGRKGVKPALSGPIFPEMLRMLDTGLEIEGLERHQAPRIDPVLQSADQYINELNRATSAQLDAVGDVPDSQRSAILANMNAIAVSNIAKYINEVNFNNARQINEADRFNEMAYVQTDDKNIAERQRYESGLLKAMAIRDENLARYYDSINSEIQNKFNVRTSLNTIASIAPNMRMLPSGQIIYVQGNQDVMNMGDYSTPYLRSLNEEDDENKRRRRTK